MKLAKHPFALLLLPLLLLNSCAKYAEIETSGLKETDYATEKVIVVTIDGERYSDTWGSNPDLIQNRRLLSESGAIYTNFKNEGLTKTVSGHTAVTTGKDQHMQNGGKEDPVHPSFLQLYLDASGKGADKAYVITAKEKLRVLAESRHSIWKYKHLPSSNAFDRNDIETFHAAIDVLNNNEPDVVLLHFGGPDKAAHNNDWLGYLESISRSDSLVGELFSFINSHPAYKGKTTVFITNDHGRHNDSKGGFKSHGCTCDGCRHITLEAFGPDFKEGAVLTNQRSLTDIAPTVSELLGVDLITDHFQGTVMTELFK